MYIVIYLCKCVNIHSNKLFILFIRLVCSVTPEGVGSFEGVLFPIFQVILQQDILGTNKDNFCLIHYILFICSF